MFRVLFTDVKGIWDVESSSTASNKQSFTNRYYESWGPDHKFDLQTIELDGKTLKITYNQGSQKAIDLIPGDQNFSRFLLALTETDDFLIQRRTDLLITLQGNENLKYVTMEYFEKTQPSQVFELYNTKTFLFSKRL